MEASSCVKAVVVAGNQYLNSPTDAHLTHLQRQLDVLVSVTAKGSLLTYFEPSDLLPTQCISSIVEILNETQVKPLLAQKIMLLINNLADEEVIRQVLHSKFGVTVALARYLRNNMAASSEPTIFQCARLLQRVTYNCRISFQESYLDDLIKFAIKHIQPKETELTLPCMGLLANLTRHNFAIQAHIKNLENSKGLFKTLLMFMSNNNLRIVVYALSIITNLCFHEEPGQTLFNSHNIHKTFQLMINMLINEDSMTTRSYTVDLFIDILRITHIQQSFVRYEHLESSLKRVLHLIPQIKHPDVYKIFDLLLSFCTVNGVRSIVCRSLLTTPSLQEPARYRELVKSQNARKSEPFFAVLHLAAQSVDTHNNAPLLALEFLREVYQEAIDIGLVGQADLHVDQILPLVTEILMAPINTTTPAAAKHCLRTVNALQVLIALSSDDTLIQQAASAITSDICVSLVEYQLNHNGIAVSQRAINSSNPSDWSHAGVQVVLHTLNIMKRFRRHVLQMESALNSLLQDSRLVPFLAAGMTTDNRSEVQMALQLLSIGSQLPEFPIVVLGESIAANNISMATAKQQDDKELTLSHSPLTGKALYWNWDDDKENTTTRKLSERSDNNSRVSVSDATIDDLIEKMQTSVDLKDVRSSEIINMYEHKLQSLQTKENHLTDLLEAKAMALSQADRLIAQYRSRRAQSDAEAQKLRSLLRESEKGAEEQREKRNEAESERDRLATEMDQALVDLARLEAVATDYENLVVAHREQTQKLEASQRNLAALKQEHQTVAEMAEMLRRHNETLKQQLDMATEQVTQLEEESKSMKLTIKEKATKEQELSKGLSKAEDRLKKITKERDESEKAVDRLRTDLSKTEKAKKALQHQVTTLEVVCQKHEDSLAEKDITLAAQKTELEKHAQIAALIHNLSSGTVPPQN